MKPLEAYGIISRDMDELIIFRKKLFPDAKGYSQEEIAAQVMAFEALRRMQEEGAE